MSICVVQKLFEKNNEIELASGNIMVKLLNVEETKICLILTEYETFFARVLEKCNYVINVQRARGTETRLAI